MANKPTPLVPSRRLLDLGPEFYDSVRAAEFPRLQLRYFNPELCQQLGWSPEELRRYAGLFEPVPGSLDGPLAMRYHGHQFQHYNPELGDGRGFSFAQFEGDGKLWELGTKGSGQTPYSRRGDGRLTLKGAVRESLATEMLQSLGVNTSRTLVFFETGEQLTRGDEPSPTRSAVLTRFSHSHIRFGSFQRLAYLQQIENLKKLFDYSVQNLVPLPHRPGLTSSGLVASFLSEVCRRSADLTAQWMITGFVHGVLNTDNMNITGESFDYGPYRFLPTYDPDFTAAYFDESGLYSYGRQPQAVLWNVYQLGQALKLLDANLDLGELSPLFEAEFHDSVRRHFLKRLNLKSRGAATDDDLLLAFFSHLQSSQAGFEQSFFDFFQTGMKTPAQILEKSKNQNPELKTLLQLWPEFAVDDASQSQNPYWQKESPVTLLIHDIEKLWQHIDQNDDWNPYQQKLKDIRSLR